MNRGWQRERLAKLTTMMLSSTLISEEKQICGVEDRWADTGRRSMSWERIPGVVPFRIWGHLVYLWSPDSSLKKLKQVGLKSKPSSQSCAIKLQFPFTWNQWLLHVIPRGAGLSLGSGKRVLPLPGHTQQQSRPFSNQDRGCFWELGSLKENSTVFSKLRSMSFSHKLWYTISD